MYYDNLKFAQRQWLDELLNKKKFPTASMIIDNVSLVGKPKTVETISRNHYLALKRLDISADQQSLKKYFKRIVINKEMIVSKDYTKVKKRNSFTVLLKNDHVFEIKYFIVIEVQNFKTCYALGQYFERCPNTLFPERTLQHLTFAKKSNSLAAINVQEIKQKVIVVKIPDDESLFVACTHPNRFELIN